MALYTILYVPAAQGLASGRVLPEGQYEPSEQYPETKAEPLQQYIPLGHAMHAVATEFPRLHK